MYSLPQSYNQTSKCKRCISSNAYAKLTNSIRNTYTKEQDIETEDPFACYEGDWGGNMSAEEYADDLRKP